MTVVFRIVLIVASIATAYFMLKKIQQSKVKIEDSIFWILFSVMLIVLCIVPQLADFMAKLLGIKSTVNFIFLFIIFLAEGLPSLLNPEYGAIKEILDIIK